VAVDRIDQKDETVGGQKDVANALARLAADIHKAKLHLLRISKIGNLQTMQNAAAVERCSCVHRHFVG
jgi:hypothetical protein